MNKPEITISINPSYFCNFDCSFCYLTTEQLADRTLLDINTLELKLIEVSQIYQIVCIDIYGGEIALLTEEYLNALIDLSKKHTSDINLITNLSRIHPSFLRSDISLSVSWDGPIRRKSDIVFENLLALNREVNLLMLAGPEMLSWSSDEIKNIISQLNTVNSIRSVEIKPYSSNQANNYSISYLEFEEFLKVWFPAEKNFVFVNQEKLEGVFRGTSHSFSDDHLYINPEGQFCVLDFDQGDNEEFVPLKEFSDYLDWSNREKVKIANNSFCSQCEYLGSCLSEHLRDVKSLDNSCNGFKLLIDWYKSERLQS